MKYYSGGGNKGHNLRPPDLYEYYVDNFWFDAAGLESQKINEPLRGSQKADVVIVGGGYTGLSAAYHIRKKLPDLKIVLLEGACCGYGASGRNGGFCITTDLVRESDHEPTAVRESCLRVSNYGMQFIKQMITEHQVDCDFEENGMLGVALNDSQVKGLKTQQKHLGMYNLDSTFLEGDALNSEIKSPLFLAGLNIPSGAILNPAKLAREMKRVVEQCGVEIRERTVATRITPGKINLVDTELGEISAPVLVLAVNAYSHKLGFFKDRVFPISIFQITTEPLSDAQWASIGWDNRQGLYDMRTNFSYLAPSADGRIVMGGSGFAYYDRDAVSSGNDKFVTALIERDFYKFFPSLKDVKIEYAWGGTTTYTLNRIPSVGVMGDHRNIYYGVGLSEGVPTTQTFGRIIADLMAGESNEFTNHYVVNRNIPYAGPTSVRKYFVNLGMRLMENMG
jgi:glycine/D-amino acid oxidase-like deaminating enzyme